MNHGEKPPEPGLHLVATPIGNARDITLRALDILRGADVLAAEDTRTLRHLMEIHGIPVGQRELIAYHDHSGEGTRARIAARIAEGKSVAYVSEAGTPLISDPGFALGRAVVDAGGAVLSAPGASAVLAALAVAGLPTDRFLFLGFAPPGKSARQTLWAEVAQVPATLVLYESPRRVADLLAELAQGLGPDRPAALCRELTKRFEEVIRAPLGELAEQVAARTIKGECVVVVDRASAPVADGETVDNALRKALETMRVKDAATVVAGSLGLPRREVYQRALDLAKGD